MLTDDDDDISITALVILISNAALLTLYVIKIKCLDGNLKWLKQLDKKLKIIANNKLKKRK